LPITAGAEAAVKKLAEAGIEYQAPQRRGQGLHTDEKVVGFYNAGDRIKFWASAARFGAVSGAGSLGALFMTIPFVGHVIVLGYLASIVLSAIEGAVVVGGLTAC